jgi:hypothetical protein
MTTTHFRLGALPITLDGSGGFTDALAAELAPVRSDAVARAGEPDLAIVVTDKLPPLADVVAMSPVRVAHDAFEHQVGRLRYQVGKTASGLRITVQVASPGAFRSLSPVALQRAMHFNHLDHWERRVKTFVYDIFDYVAQSSLLPLDQSFVHASSMERDGRAVALLAWGGIGKTTSLLKLVLEDGWRFLSDDLGLIGADAVLHRSPKHLQVYGYNLAGQPAIERAMLEGRTGLDRASWEFFKVVKGAHRVRRRVSAEQLFGTARVATSGKLQHAIFLQRHSGRDFRRVTLTPRALAERCASILLHELSPYGLVASAVHGAGNAVTIPSVWEMQRRALDVLTKAFSTVPCESVDIPSGAGPDALVGYLRGVLPAK